MRDIAQTHLQLYNQLRRQEKSEKDLVRIHRAYELATNLYPGYYQADGKPFVTHCVGVASIMGHLGLAPSSYRRDCCITSTTTATLAMVAARIITKARRDLVRNAVGDDIEALIDRFRAFRIRPATIDEIWRRLEQFNQDREKSHFDGSRRSSRKIPGRRGISILETTTGWWILSANTAID